MENIKKIIEAHIPSKAELLSFKFNSRSSFIKIVIDSIEEISINDTALLARNIKNDDYIVSNFPKGLKLEVGTPGVGSKLERTFQYEKNIGRKKSARNSPRECDIDILDYENKIINGRIILPHPRMHTRNFVLLPLFELNKDWKHPVYKHNIKTLILLLSNRDIRSIKQI